MRLEFELTRQDYIDFNMDYMFGSKSIRRTFLIQRYVFPMIFLIVPFVLQNVSTIPLTYWLIVFGITFFAWIVFYSKFITWRIKKSINKMLDESKNKNILGHHCLTISEEGISDISSSGESKAGWDTVERISDKEGHVFIYIGTGMGYIIPSVAFSDLNERKQFADKLKYYSEKQQG